MSKEEWGKLRIRLYELAEKIDAESTFIKNRLSNKLTVKKGLCNLYNLIKLKDLLNNDYHRFIIKNLFYL